MWSATWIWTLLFTYRVYPILSDSYFSIQKPNFIPDLRNTIIFFVMEICNFHNTISNWLQSISDFMQYNGVSSQLLRKVLLKSTISTTPLTIVITQLIKERWQLQIYCAQLWIYCTPTALAVSNCKFPQHNL